MRDLNTKSYDTILTECSDLFAAQGISIIGEGYKEIATNKALFEAYVESLTEGVTNADDAVVMAQLMSNTNAAMLRESSMTGIQPVASLSMPVIRKLWPKFGLKDAVETEVAKAPRFVISYTAPYMIKGDEKVYIPRSLRETSIDADIPEALTKEYTRGHVVELAAGAAAKVDFVYLDGVSGETDEHVKIQNTPSASKIQPLDELIVEAYVIGDRVVTATAEDVAALNANKSYVVWDARFLTRKDTNGLGVVSAANVQVGDKAYELVEVIKIGKRLGVYGNAVYNFNGGQLIVQFDGAKDTATFAALGKKVMVTCHAAVSSEYNEEGFSVGFDVLRQDIDIPTGQHLNASLPIESLNDLNALYQIDGTKETVDLMTNVFAQKLDLEVLNFIKKSHLNQPGNEAFQDGTYGVVNDYTLAFDCKPAAGFAGSPKAWREELKPLIDHLAQRIKSATYLTTGIFNIIGNPIDIQILANIDWQFRGGQGGNVDGVDADYSVGTYVGANSYKVLASNNVPAGQLFIVFLPSGGTQMTYKYYPYTFSTEMGYVDPNRSRTPSIMMTKRHQLHEFMPAIGCIVILNNDGKSLYAQYSNWKAVE